MGIIKEIYHLTLQDYFNDEKQYQDNDEEESEKNSMYNQLSPNT